MRWIETEIKLKDLKEYEKNPRKISKVQLQRLVNSIQEDGYRTRIAVDVDNTIIGGHQRKRALKAAGFKDNDLIPVLIPERKLSEEEFQRINIRDNGHFGDWDMDGLANFGIEIENLIDWGVPEDLFSGMLGVEEIEELEGEDEAPEVDEANIITVLGDLWVMGEHRLLCGDSTNFDNIDILLESQKADMVFTDPPYNMDFTGGLHGDGTKSFNAKHGKIKNDKMSKEEAESFFDGVNTVIKNYCTGAFYITFYRLGIYDYWKSLDRVGLSVRSLIIWDKGNHTLSNSDYMSMYEPIFYGWVKDHNFYGGNNGKDIWDIERTKKNDLHPTMKPVKLVEKAIIDGSKRGDTVMDIFGGSGTTLIACEKTSRKARLIELDPKYCDVIIKRWEDITGFEAVHAETGKTFKEMSNDRIKA